MLSEINKEYVFSYKINRHVTDKRLEEVKKGPIAELNNTPDDDQVTYSWSLYVKMGKKTHVVW